MPIVWYVAGIVTTLVVLIMVLPWLRSILHMSAVPTIPWQASLAAGVAAVGLFGVFRWVGPPTPSAESPRQAVGPTQPLGANSTGSAPSIDNSRSFGNAAKIFRDATDQPGGVPTPETNSSAGSMESAVASLEARLAKGGGTADDWELLAKSFEFLGRPADAAKARAKQLPQAATMASMPAAAINGEITLDPALRAKVSAGEILFVVAKSVDSPGMPVAVLRSSVGAWPLKFKLDDSQSMMPGKNLSSAGRVIIEARISAKGQPLPMAGDLQGSTGIVDPGDHRPLTILIDHVIT